MATHPRRSRWTYEEFARLPEDGNRYEVIAGELYVSPAPRPRHQLVVGRLYQRVAAFADDHELGIAYPGPIDVLFAEGDYLEPDLVFVRHDRLEIVSERGIEGAPDLIVEVLSASTASRDRGIKREHYILFGVPQYWVVDIEKRSIEVYRPASEANEPMIASDTLTWQPIAGGPVLTLSMPAVFRGTA